MFELDTFDCCGIVGACLFNGVRVLLAKEFALEDFMGLLFGLLFALVVLGLLDFGALFAWLA